VHGSSCCVWRTFPDLRIRCGRPSALSDDAMTDPPLLAFPPQPCILDAVAALTPGGHPLDHAGIVMQSWMSQGPLGASLYGVPAMRIGH